MSSPTARQVYLHEFSARSLRETFLKRVDLKGGSGRDGTSTAAFKESIASEIAIIRRTALRGTYKPSAYKEHLSSKGAGKVPRQLSIPTVRDRLVLRALNQSISTLVEASRVPLAPTVVAGLIRDLESSRFDSYVRLDVMDFYPSIRHLQLERTLTKHIKSRVLVRQVMRMVRTPTLGRARPEAPTWPCIGIPQGLSISNNLAEIAMFDFDEWARALPDTAYRRFVDDILLLCDSAQIDELSIAVPGMLRGLGLHTHEIKNSSKSAAGLVAEPFEYLGYRFEWPRITVRQGSIVSIKTSLTRVMTAYKKYADSHSDSPHDVSRALERCRLRLNLKISGCVYEGTRRGWMAFFSQIRHQQLLRHLDWYVKSEMARFGLIGKFEPKTFVKSYRCAAKAQADTTGFVPNFDDLDIDESRRVLVDYFLLNPFVVAGLDEAKVTTELRARLNRLVSDLDRDTGTGYR